MVEAKLRSDFPVRGEFDGRIKTISPYRIEQAGINIFRAEYRHEDFSYELRLPLQVDNNVFALATLDLLTKLPKDPHDKNRDILHVMDEENRSKLFESNQGERISPQLVKGIIEEKEWPYFSLQTSRVRVTRATESPQVVINSTVALGEYFSHYVKTLQPEMPEGKLLEVLAKLDQQLRDREPGIIPF